MCRTGGNVAPRCGFGWRGALKERADWLVTGVVPAASSRGESRSLGRKVTVMRAPCTHAGRDRIAHLPRAIAAKM